MAVLRFILFFFPPWLAGPRSETTLGLVLDGTCVWVGVCACVRACAHRQGKPFCVRLCAFLVRVHLVLCVRRFGRALCTPLSDLISLTHVKRSTFFPLFPLLLSFFFF